MQVFAVFNVRDAQRVLNGLTKHYPNNHYVAGGNVFFVATKDETTRGVADKIGLGDDIEGMGVSSGIVIPVTNYWGRGDRDMWEWISVRQASNG